MRWDDIVIGGTGIGEAVFNNAKWRNRFRLVKHSSYGEMRVIVGQEWLAGKTVFSVVRNPIDRFISCCNFLMANVARKEAWIQQFVERYGLETGVGLDFFLQDKFIDPEVITNPKDELHRFFALQSFFVGAAGIETFRLEELAGSMERIAQIMGIHPVPNVPHENESARSYSRADLSSDIEDRLKAIYQKDFESLGYSSD
jgi:hypothetical protein